MKVNIRAVYSGNNDQSGGGGRSLQSLLIKSKLKPEVLFKS